MKRKALVVGVAHYKNFPNLFASTADAQAVRDVLRKNGDDSCSTNFDVRYLEDSEELPVRCPDLRKGIRELFDQKCSTALFYFAGHARSERADTYLILSDSDPKDDGFPLSELIAFANSSPAENRIIILDCCHAGRLASAVIREGTTILASSMENQEAIEKHGKGVFTSLLVDALNGAAANLLGQVTPGGVYAHIDQSLGSWEQRPIFNANVSAFVSLRQVKPFVEFSELREITHLFLRANDFFQLDPSFEPERSSEDSELPTPNPQNVQKFSRLQQYAKVGLVVPVDAPHMWHAAMQSKQCRLTPLGKHYHNLVKQGKI